MSFSFKDRALALQNLSQVPTDVAVIGGGIVGCSVAAHVARLGMSVVLLEKDDFASGASGNSTGLAHAGIRYLAQGRVLYVLQESRERLFLQQMAPHWVRAFDFLFPVYRGDPFNLHFVRLGTWLYDAFTRFYTRRVSANLNIQRYRVVDSEELTRRVPGLATAGLQGATEYFVDARLPDARFTLGFAQQAVAHGARCLSRAPVERLEKTEDCSWRLQGHDLQSGEPFELKARLVVNATGPWIDEVRALAGWPTPCLQRSRGSHLVVDRLSPMPLIFSRERFGQVFFVIPYGRSRSIVGTTDILQEGPTDAARPSSLEVKELATQVVHFFPDHKRSGESTEEAVRRYIREHVHGLFWGIRPLVQRSGSSLWASREHAVIQEGHLFWSIPGVKLTAARRVGVEVARAAWSALRGGRVPPLGIDPLPGAEGLGKVGPQAPARGGGHAPGMPEDVYLYLVHTYGTRWPHVWRLAEVDGHWGERLVEGEPWVRAQIPYAVENEMVLTINDFLWRRTGWARIRTLTQSCVEQVAHDLQGLLGWSDTERNHQLELFLDEKKRREVPI